MIKQLIEDGWAYHDSEPDRLANELEAAANASPGQEFLSPFLNLSNHTIGDHLGDWERARRLAESVIADIELNDESYKAGGFLAVSRFMCGDSLGAYEAELSAAKAFPADPFYPILDSRMQLARSLLLKKRSKEAWALYNAVANLLVQVKEDGNLNRSFAVTSNNIASDLLARTKRNEDEDALIVNSASGALRFWRLCGTWENEERALYLLALVTNASGKFTDALEHARKALEIINNNGGEPVDEAFIRLAVADAHRNLNSDTGYVAELGRADELAKSWNDESLFAWYQETRSKVVPG